MEDIRKAIGYKLFKVKSSRPGELFPLYVTADQPTPIGVWIDAECGELTENGKVKSKLGELAYRPGFHINDGIPYVSHIGKKDENGNIAWIPEILVWCEVSYPTKVDYQPKANQNGINKQGKLIPENAQLKEIPIDGYYKYKTNPKMDGSWVIAGAIKINRILSDAEVYDLCKVNGYESLHRWGGEFNAEKYGLETMVSKYKEREVM